MVSTDQFALSRSRANLEAQPSKALVSANVLADIARLTDSEDGSDVEISMSQNHIYFTTKNLSCFSRLIDGQYYAYEQVIPKTFSTSATIPTEELQRASSRAAIVASEEDRSMRLISARS